MTNAVYALFGTTVGAGDGDCMGVGVATGVLLGNGETGRAGAADAAGDPDAAGDADAPAEGDGLEIGLTTALVRGAGVAEPRLCGTRTVGPFAPPPPQPAKTQTAKNSSAIADARSTTLFFSTAGDAKLE